MSSGRLQRRPTPKPPMSAARFMELVRAHEARKQAEEQASRPTKETKHTEEFWMLLTADQAHELSMGRVPEGVQRMAELATEPTEVKLARNAARK